ncbi:MAG TPA: DegV family protein, partial [Longimicrobiales bacterium]|nr:DegV family protein [Longimicrobiales bacterium]
LLERVLGKSKESLARTPDLLPMLKKAGVVDAGAKGFVHILEGIVSFMRGDPFIALKTAPVFDAGEAAAGKVEYPTESERYRFCTEGLVRGEKLPESAVVQEYLRTRGDSLIVIRGNDILKVHVHTDVPEDVFVYLRSFGTLVTHKAEDMAAQHQAVERANASHIQLARRPMSIVTDSACDLPDEIVRAHGIHVVPMTVIPGEEGRPATTSQPAPAAFLEYYRRAAEDGEEILCLPVASSLSGTFASAEAAAKRFEDVRITMIDTCGASLTQGMLVLRASELAERGKSAVEIADEVKRIRKQSGIMFTVDVFDNLLRSGRVGRGKAMLAGWLGIKPILELNEEGRVLPLSRVRGMERALPRMIEVLQQRIPAKAKALRFGVIHVDCPQVVDAARTELIKKFGEREIISAPATPVIATHLGPGAWGLCWQLED